MFSFQLASFKMDSPLRGLVSSNGASECVMTDHKTRIIVTLDLDSRNDKFAIWGVQSPFSAVVSNSKRFPFVVL